MRLLLDRRHDLHEPLDVVGGDAPRDRVLEIGEVAVDTPGRLHPFRRGRDHERPAILGADVARDEAALGKAIENTGQGRSLVRETAVQRGNRRRPGRRQQREDVRFALRQAVVTQVGQIEADSMRRAMNRGNQA
jgi:hypothetical protein